MGALFGKVSAARADESPTGTFETFTAERVKETNQQGNKCEKKMEKIRLR